MYIYKGFVLVPDVNSETDEVRNVPFSPFILNSSIICGEDPILIDDRLKLMSERWTLSNVIDSVDKTSYVYDCNYKNLTTDDTGEAIGSENLIASIQYDMYRNGYMDIEADIRLDGDAGVAFGKDRKLFLKKFYLPYNLLENAMVEASCLLGTVEGVTIAASLDQKPITNKNLNKTGSEKRYFNTINITQIVPASGGEDVPLDLVYRSVDDDYSRYGYDDYVSKYLPIKLKISGVQYH